MQNEISRKKLLNIYSYVERKLIVAVMKKVWKV